MGFFQSLAKGDVEGAFRSPGETPQQAKAQARRDRVEAQQQALIRLQEQFYTQQTQLAEQRNRGIMESLGYRQDPSTGEFVRLPQTEAERQFGTISRLQRERQISALEGTGVVDPALERDIAEAQAQAQRQADQVGGVESTAGRQIMAKFNEWANITRSQGRRAEITGGFQNILGGGQQDLQRRQQILSGFGSLDRGAGTRGQILSSIGGVLGQIDTSVPTTQQTSPLPNLLSTAGSVIGGIYGGGVGSYAGGQIGGTIGSQVSGQPQQQRYGYYPYWQRRQGGGYRPSSGGYYGRPIQ